MDPRRARLRDARLYLVCDVCDDAFLDAALSGGVDVIQLRDKTASDDALVSAGRRFALKAKLHRALFILNDRPDLVEATGADGVHVGQDDASVTAARSHVGPDRIVGLSTHTPAQVDSAAGVDYIGVGPVHATPTKPGRPAVGTALVAYAAAHATVPFFAIGGVDDETIDAVRDAGATRVAVVRAITDAEDPRAAAARLRAAIGSGVPVAGP